MSTQPLYTLKIYGHDGTLCYSFQQHVPFPRFELGDTLDFLDSDPRIEVTVRFITHEVSRGDNNSIIFTTIVQTEWLNEQLDGLTA